MLVRLARNMRGVRFFFVLSTAVLLALCSVVLLGPIAPNVREFMEFGIVQSAQSLTLSSERTSKVRVDFNAVYRTVQELAATPTRQNENQTLQVANYGTQELVTNDNFLFSWFGERGIKFRKGVSLRREQPETELERRLLAPPPLTDVASLPDRLKSQVTIVSSGQSKYRVGDSLRVLVDLYDSRGKPRTAGGDEIRIWLTSQQAGKKMTSLPRYAVAAKVTDMRNGSYLGETVLKWAGQTSIRVSLTYPREFFRTMVFVRHTLHSSRWVTGVFTDRRGARETTPCLPSSPVPGFAGVCNFTSLNSDIPWYCGQPTDPRLNCSHWAEISNMPYTELVLPPAEAYMVRKVDSDLSERLIPVRQQISVLRDPRQSQKKLPPCYSLPPRDTWDTQSPNGWFDQRSWRPSTCSVPELTSQRARKCMRSTTLVLMGDSNMALFYNLIKRRLGLGCTNKNAEGVHNSPKDCKFSQLNSSLHWARHAVPYNVGGHANLQVTLRPRTLDGLHVHQDNQLVVGIHYYLHLSMYPLTAYKDRARATRQAVERLLQRVPTAKVFVRGPHVIYHDQQMHAAFGDAFGPVYTQIWREEFRGLWDRVWFLDYWDLTIACENYLLHPPEFVAMEMIKVLFGYFCDTV